MFCAGNVDCFGERLTRFTSKREKALSFVFLYHLEGNSPFKTNNHMSMLLHKSIIAPSVFLKHRHRHIERKCFSFCLIFPERDLLFHAFLMTFDLGYQSGACVQLWGISLLCHTLILTYTHVQTHTLSLSLSILLVNIFEKHISIVRERRNKVRGKRHIKKRKTK